MRNRLFKLKQNSTFAMNLRFHTVPLLVLQLTPALAGQPDSAKGFTVPQAASPWRIGGGYGQLFGLKAEFSGLGNLRSSFTPQSPGPGIDRDYDNGFVRVDSSGNLGGETWNWSYDDATQYNPEGTGSIDYSITNSLANGQTNDSGASEPGFELFAYYFMGPADLSGLKISTATWGFRGGLQYSSINMGNHDHLSTKVGTTTDSFDLGGSIPPLAPYTGSFSGPGPLLGDEPVRSTGVSDSGHVSGKRDLDVDLTLATFGTYLQIPVTAEVDFLLEAGASLGVAHGSYYFNSETAIEGVGTQQSNGHESNTELLPGVYFGLSGIYQINERFSLIGGVRYQYMSGFELEANGSKATLSFDSAFMLSLGGVYSF